MAGKTYDEEDYRLARVIYCKPEYRSYPQLIELMRQEAPERYKTLQPSTVAKWKKRDKSLGIDWEELRREKQVQRAKLEGTLAVNTAEDLQSTLLADMLEITEMIRNEIQRQKAILVKSNEEAEDDDAKAEFEIVFTPGLTRLLSAYQKAHTSALSLVQRKIKDVDVSRLSKENQVFFLRRVLEDIEMVAGGIDPELSTAWTKYKSAVLERLRGPYSDEVITEVRDDLCLDKLIERLKERDAGDSNQKDADQGTVAGVHGAGTGTD